MARLGASVTGIDVTDAAVTAAKACENHAADINYQTISTEELAKSGVILMLFMPPK